MFLYAIDFWGIKDYHYAFDNNILKNMTVKI